jgi:xanthosine utilization system XapX-like protein
MAARCTSPLVARPVPEELNVVGMLGIVMADDATDASEPEATLMVSWFTLATVVLLDGTTVTVVSASSTAASA